jgi:hypothetical protein
MLPNLHFRPYYQRSEIDPGYNCLAFAVDRNDIFVSTSPVNGYHWPPRNERRLDSWSEYIKQHGFEDCDDGTFEPGFQKIALYATAQGPKHAAKQLKNGSWASKLGSNIDIEHPHLDALEGDLYGTPVKFFRTAREDWMTSDGQPVNIR